jgi:hypothetical protein
MALFKSHIKIIPGTSVTPCIFGVQIGHPHNNWYRNWHLPHYSHMWEKKKKKKKKANVTKLLQM